MEKAYQTKMQLVSAFKEIIVCTSFHKIKISQISDKAGMSRKSFYYHFQDKYELVNWIFDTEFADQMKANGISGYRCLELLCHYLYSERAYYRRVLCVSGQNSLSEYLELYIQQQLYSEFSGDENAELKTLLLTDAFLVMLKRWILELDNMDAFSFICQIKDIFRSENKQQVISAVMPLQSVYS